jgi:hypothetical protein
MEAIMAEPSSNTTPVSLTDAVNQYLTSNPKFDFSQLGVRDWFGRRVVIGYDKTGWSVIDIGMFTAAVKACGAETVSSRGVVGKQWKAEGCPIPLINEDLCPFAKSPPQPSPAPAPAPAPVPPAPALPIAKSQLLPEKEEDFKTELNRKLALGRQGIPKKTAVEAKAEPEKKAVDSEKKSELSTQAKWADVQAEHIRKYLQAKLDSMPSQEEVDPAAEVVKTQSPEEPVNNAQTKQEE